MDTEHVIAKYTGQTLTLDDLVAARRAAHPVTDVLTLAVERAADAVVEAEADLTRVADSIGDSLAKVRDNIDAAAGAHIRTLNPLGEMQANGPRFDALIALRHDRIGHLRAVTRLWRAQHGQPPPTT